MTSVGVVVVTYQSADVVGECIDACLAISGAEIVVVNNSCDEETSAVVRSRPRVVLIQNDNNRGFAAAVNQGMRALTSEVVLVLNPDAVPETDLSPLTEAATSPGAGAAAGRLLGLNGETQHGFNVRSLPTAATLTFEVLGLNRLLPDNPVNRRYRLEYSTNSVVEVDQPAGGFLMLNRRAWQAVGGFDESFHPVWFEDVDYCKRLRDAGFRIFYVPSVTATHIGGHSAAKLDWASRQVFWYGSLLRYAAKHFRPWPRLTVCLAVMLASIGRMIHGIAVRVSFNPVSVYSRVFWLASACCVLGERFQVSGAECYRCEGEQVVQR